MTVSLDTDALIAACQGAAWKISGWPDNIAIHHAKGCACCHKYINHLLSAQSLRQINLRHLDVKNAVQSAWPAFINSIKINADQCMQGQISNLHAQIDELKDLKSCLQSEANTSVLPPTTLATAEPTSQVVIPAWSLPQPEAGPS